MRLISDIGYRKPKPRRPALTPAFVLALVFWGACAAAYSNGMAAASAIGLESALLLAAAALICILVGFRGRLLWLLALASVLSGVLLGIGYAHSVLTDAKGAETEDARGALCVLLDDPKSNDYGWSCSAHIAFADGSECRGRLLLETADGLVCGKRLKITNGTVSVDWDDDGFLWKMGTLVSLRAYSCELDEVEGPGGILVGLREHIIGSLDDGTREGMVLQALVCGWRAKLSDSDVYGWFKSAGLAHLIAVSGAHLTIVAGFAAMLLRKVRFPRKAMIVCLVGMMFSYFIVAGEPISALRACIMASLGLFSYFGKRKPASLNAVGIALFAMITLSPECSLSASLALSCLSTSGIILLAPLFSYWLSCALKGRAPFVSDTIALTLAASVAAQPVSCALFAQLPVIAPLANLLAAPLFPACCALGLATGFIGLALPQLAGILGFVSHIPAFLLCESAHAAASIPYGCLPASMEIVLAILASIGGIAVFYVFWPTSLSAGAQIPVVAAALLGLSILWPLDSGDRIVMLDVGQGDAFLLSSHGSHALFDTGNQDKMLLAALARQGVAHLDAMVISHSDDDHCGSLDALESSIEVDAVYVAQDMLECSDDKARALISQSSDAAQNVVGLKMGDILQIGSFSCRVVWPREFTDSGGNSDSLCLLVGYDREQDGAIEARALFTGDAEEEQLESIIDDEGLSDIDILKVGHHGSRNSLNTAQASKLSPIVALISAGKDNRYGHPNPGTVEILEGCGAQVRRSDIEGDVSCIMGVNAIRICTQR